MGRLLDSGSLPVAAIARLARREGSRPRATYQTHRWFARRFAMTARALLVAAGIDERESFWDAYYAGVSYRDKRVLDPFMGGGVMLFEAARLGADVYGTDVEPVPAVICELQGKLAKLPDLEEAFERIEARVWPQLREFYISRTAEGEERLLLHAFWAQMVRCKGCRAVFTCHPSYRLAWDEKSDTQWVICRGCGDVMEKSLSRSRVRCPCGTTTVPEAGNAGDAVASCPECGNHESLTGLADREGSPAFQLVATESISLDARDRRVNMPERRLARATADDHRAYDAAQRARRRLLRSDPGAIADARIPSENRRDSRPLIYGIDRYSGLYNARQLLHLALLGREIAALPEDLKLPMALAFSDHLATNNMLCAYAGGWRRLTPLFSLRGYRHIVRPVELNPWLRKSGRGTMPMAVRSVRRAALAARTSVEPSGFKGFVSVPASFDGTWNTTCADAADLGHLAAQSIDLALTDPPYMDYIGYSELGHFFVPWLVKFGLIDRHHLERFPSGQLAVPRKNARALAHFREGLNRAFAAVTRVLKDDGRVVFTYQNTDRRGWEALASALSRAGLSVVTTFPMLGESGPNLHKHEQSISWDAVLVCMKCPRSTFEGTFNSEAIERGKKQARSWHARLADCGERLTAADVENLGNAFTLLYVVNDDLRSVA